MVHSKMQNWLKKTCGLKVQFVYVWWLFLIPYIQTLQFFNWPLCYLSTVTKVKFVSLVHNSCLGTLSHLGIHFPLRKFEWTCFSIQSIPIYPEDNYHVSAALFSALQKFDPIKVSAQQVKWLTSLEDDIFTGK